MYTEFFGFNEKPFRLKPDPRFFYSNAGYEQAYGSILSSILECEGFVALTGEAGTGKTALIRKCVNNLENNVRFIFFPNSILSFEDILDELCDEMGLPVKAGEYFNKTRVLKTFLSAQVKFGKIFAVVIDDAQSLDKSVLHNLQSLSQSPRTKQNLLQFILVGLPELQDKLQFKDLVHCALEPLKNSEVGVFINQQLSAVGHEKNNLFTPAAIRRIAAYSKGIPRSISALCDSALFIASLSQRHSITPDIIEEAAQNCFLTEGIDLADWAAADGVHKLEKLTAAPEPMPASPPPTTSDSRKRSANVQPVAPSPSVFKPRPSSAAVRAKDLKVIEQPRRPQPVSRSVAYRLPVAAVMAALLIGAGALVFHYQSETDFLAGTLTAARNWLDDTLPRQAVQDHTPTATAAIEPNPETSVPTPAPAPMALPSASTPPAAATTVAVVELPAVDPKPPRTGTIIQVQSQQPSAPFLPASQGAFVELKGADSAAYRSNNVINLNPSTVAAPATESRRVAELLERAGRQLAEQQFISPAGDNALDTYRQILRLRPGYSDALEGIDIIKDYYKRQAAAAARSADWEKAQALYETALMVDSEDRVLADVLYQIRQKNRR